MTEPLLVILIVVGVLVVIAGALLIWFVYSPLLAVRILRKYDKMPVEFPEDFAKYEKQVQCHRDLVYPSHADCNRFDLYLPKARSGTLPVLLWVHGGSFVAGVKEGEAHWATMLASEGLAVAAFEYRRAPDAHWPSQLIQLGECCRELCRIAGDYGLDMRRMILAGDSAGAHIAAQFTLIHTSPAFSAASGLKPVLEPDSLRAVLLYCGLFRIIPPSVAASRQLRYMINRIGRSYFGRHRWENTLGAKISDIGEYVTEAFPPTYLTDGNTMSFENQAQALLQILNNKGVFVTSRFFPKEAGAVGHGFTFAMKTPQANLVYADTISFLRQLDLLSGAKEEIK